MKKAVCILCCLALTLVFLLLPGGLAHLPWEGEPAEAAYTGVVRLWVYDGLSFLSPWLESCCRSFQKTRNGVYVHIRRVSEAELLLAPGTEITAPDAIIYPSGLLPSAQGLFPLSSPHTLTALPQTGCALPIAMSGYILCRSASDPAALTCPEDSRFFSYSAALIASSARYETAAAPVRPGEGMDLGLPTPAPTKSAARPAKISCPPTVLSRNPAASILPSADASPSLLLSAHTALRSLARTVSSSDYTLSFPGVPFTDQVYWYSLPRGENPLRRQAALDLGHYLLETGCQEQLRQVNACSTLSDPPPADAMSPVAPLEAALHSPALLAAPPFGSHWRETAALLWADLFAGKTDAWTALARLKTALAPTENDP